MTHPGDLLAADLLDTFPGTIEVDHDPEDWTTIEAFLGVTIETRNCPRPHPDGGGLLDVPVSAACFDNTPCEGAGR